MTNDTFEREPRSREAALRAKLYRMLQSTSRKFPRSHLIVTSGGFGVRLEDNRYLLIQRSGKWATEDIRDLLVLFALWCVADPERIVREDTPLAGVSVAGIEPKS